MKVCSRCLYGDSHPFGITFNSDGVCSGCQVHEEKDNLDWAEREQSLKKLVAGYKNKNRMAYDCIVPVSDNIFFTLDYVINVLGLNPLVVSYNRHYNSEVGIRNSKYLRRIIGADIITQTIDPNLVKDITRVTFKEFASIHWHCLAGQTCFPVQMAVSMKIPLIIWGAHQAVEQVGMFSHLDEVEMTERYRKEHDLMGYDSESLEGFLSDKHLKPFRYPHDKSIEAVGVRGIYLSNYVRWDSKVFHEQSIEKHSYKPQFQRRSFDSYNHVECAHYLGVHDYLKLLKCGYSKVTDHACREIRFNRITRDEALSLVLSYQNRPVTDLDCFLSWSGISREEFDETVESFRKEPVTRGQSVAELVRSAERKLSFQGQELYGETKQVLLARGYSW